MPYSSCTRRWSKSCLDSRERPGLRLVSRAGSRWVLSFHIPCRMASSLTHDTMSSVGISRARKPCTQVSKTGLRASGGKTPRFYRFLSRLRVPSPHVDEGVKINTLHEACRSHCPAGHQKHSRCFQPPRSTSRSCLMTSKLGSSSAAHVSPWGTWPLL